MAALTALVLYAIWLTIAFGLRTLIQLRRTGDSGMRGAAKPGSAQWWAKLLFVGALATGAAAPVAELLGLGPFAPLDHPAVRAVGAVLALAGLASTVGAQLSMGDSWRIGVDETEHTVLVTAGAFRRVRNPIFTAMIVTAAGLTLLVPNGIAVAGLVALVAAIQAQVRLVEEPYLRHAHGTDYLGYAAMAGRFVPGVGRLTIKG